MEKDLPYGFTGYSFRFPQETVELVHTEPVRKVDPSLLREEVTRYVDTAGSGIQSVGIVVSDKTRLCEYPKFLPVITGSLMDDGIDASKITFYIAYGTHPRQTEEESIRSYSETYHQFNFVHHDSRDEGQLVMLGTTSRGTEVKINKALLDHDLLISFGAVLHHYFAGFGGGRKLLFPGMAGYNAILKNHSLFLDFDAQALSEGCQSGNLEDNPLAKDLEEINALLPERLEIHAILNSHKEVCEIHFGHNYDDFKKVCRHYDHFYRITENKEYDLVVATAGGYPKDINFIQAHKSIHNAASFVKDNGSLIILAECSDGIGNKAFMNLFRLGGWNLIFDQMAINYENNAGTALSMLQKAKRIKIYFVTSLDEETCELMGAIKTEPEEVQTIIDSEHGDIALIENASLIYK